MTLSDVIQFEGITEKLGKKAIAQKKKKSVVIPDSCPGKDNNMSCHAGYRTRAIVFQKKNTFDNKTQEKAKNTSSVCSVSKNDRDVDFTTKNFLHEVASRKRKVKTFKNKNQGNAHGNQQSNGIPEKSAEFKATKEDCVINSQDSLVNEDTCKEIYSMELDRISSSKKYTKNECSPKDSDSKTSEEPQGKENYHQSSTSDIHNTKTKKMENSEATKEIQQICMKKNLKSKRGKDFEKRKIFPDQEIINKNEVDVIQSSCDFEKFENEQKSSPIASVTGSVSKELSCTMNKITTGCKKDMKKRSKNEIRNNATNEMTSNESNLDNVNGDEVIENMNASVIFGKKSRKCKSGNLKKTPDINKNIEQTMPISTSSDIPDPNENLMAFTADGIVANSEGDKDAEQNERSKRKNQMELQTKKNYSKNADLDVYDFNEVDQMRSSFAPKTQSSNCKTDKFVKCRIDVQSEIEKGITLPCISDGVSVLQMKPLELESEKEKNRKSSASKSEESKSKFDSDDEVVINKTMLQSRNKRLQKQSKEEADITSSVQSSRQTRSKRQRRKTVSKSCTKKPNTDPNVVEEIDVIQSSFGPEKDGVVDRIKSRNEDKLPSMKPLTRGKQNEKKQILVSTPLDNVEEDVENFDEENEILSFIGCSDRDGDKGCMEHLEKNHLTEDLNPFSEKNMYTVNHAEKKDNSDNDRQIKPLTEQTGKHFPNNRKSKSGRPKQKVTQKKESCKLSKLEHRILKNTVNDKKRKFNEYDSDVHSESEDKMQSENGLVLKKGFKSREMKKIKSMKSKMMDFDTKDKNGNANMQKWKTRQNKGRSISEEIKVGSFEKHTGKRKSNRQRKNVEKCDLRESDPESEDVSDSGVIHSSLYPEGDEVLKSQKLTRNENKDDLKEPLLVELVKRKRNYMQELTSNPVEDISSGEEGFVRGKNKENLSPLRCNMEHNSTKDKELFTQKNQDQGFDAAEGHGSLKNRQNQLMEWDGKEDCSQSDENSLPLFNTNLSQENAIKSLSQKKFFKDRLRPSTYQKHDLQSTCMSAAGVQTKKSCEVEYGKGKNLVYLAMSYSSTERREDVYGDPYDFDEECARSSTKSEKFCRHEGNSNAKQGKIQTPQNFDVSLKKRNSACKEVIVQSSKENLDSVSELVDDNNFALSPKESLVQNTKETLPKYSRKIVNVVNNDDVSVYSKSPSSGCLLKNRSTSKTHKQQKEHQKKEMPTKNVNRIMARFLGRKRNKSTCQDLNENEEYDHHDGLCLSKGDSSSPVKIPHCEITLDEVIGISRLNGNTDKLPCFKHHAHRGNQPKPAKLERHEVKDCVLQSTSKSMTKPKFKVTKRYSDQVPRKMRKASFSEEIEILDSEISDDQLCSSGDDNLNEELPPVNNIITRFNQFCKNIVGGPEDVVQLEKSRKVTSRAFDHASRRKQNKACRKSDPGLRRSNNLWMPKFDPEDQVEICNIKMPMTLPCSDAESSQEETIHSEDLQVQPQQEAKTECNKSRSNKLLQQTRDTDLSGLVSGYSTELRPSRSSMKRKYDSILQCGDESDLCRNHLNASYTVEMSHLRPRRLFSSDFKAVVEITDSSDNEDEEDLCTTSEHNTNSDEMLGNSVNHLEGVGIDAGVSTIVKAFGMDFQKQIQTKQHCVDVLTKTTLKSSQRHLRNMLTDRTERRNNIIEKFGKKLLAELIALQNDIKTLEDNEAKTLADFVASMCCMDQYELNFQETFKNAMKKDLTSMQRKLLLDAQKHELTAVRRSLHTMIR
ncbi:uncharacterized protein LOC132554113 [Ylistrum balloti]|uniref:uncharacterized protein LOC132554113 n=1 Tax=Ylistrum balloti TaxID=509963 RepID=UPI002905BFE8|nr:uncharacterized protein LOC132554113 [Ylistrum balloti]